MSVRKSKEDSIIIHFGATAPDLAQLFDVPIARVKQRLSGRVKPMTSVDSSAPRWRVKDAAPYLVNPKIDVEEFLRSLTPAKLPPKLQSAFWQAQNERMDFEERQGQLFNADRVREMLSTITKPVRMTILMMKHEVASREELTPRQRAVIEEISDTVLAQLRAGILKAFEGYTPPPDEHGRPIDDIAVETEMAAEIAAEDDGDGGEMDRPTSRRPPRRKQVPVGERRFVTVNTDEDDDSGIADL